MCFPFKADLKIVLQFFTKNIILQPPRRDAREEVVSNQTIRHYRNRAIGQPILQLVFALAIALGLLFFYGWDFAQAFILGGLVSVIPNFYFVTRLFKQTAARQAKSIVLRMFRTEAIKLALISILLVIFLRIGFVKVAPYILGFVLTQMSILLAPLLYWYDLTKQRF